jgi:hypothetical protein
MNELVPVKNNEIPLPARETSTASRYLNVPKFSSQNKMIICFFSLFFLLFLKYRHNTTYYRNTKEQNIQPKHIPSGFNIADPAIIDKISYLLDGIKKASAIRELSKNMLESGIKKGKPNLDFIKEMLETLKSLNDESNNSQSPSISNVMSLLDKFKDLRKIMEVQQSLKNEHGNKDMNAQINNLIEIVRPMLPEEQAENIDNLKKMAQMMKLMSLFDVPKEEKEDQGHTEQNTGESNTQNA